MSTSFRRVFVFTFCFIQCFVPSIIAAGIDPVSCTPDQIATLNAALPEALDMLQTTQSSLSSSLSEALQPDEALRVSRNYLPFFGGALTLDAQGKFQTPGQEDRAISVLGTLTTVANAVGAGSLLDSLTIICNNPPLRIEQAQDATGTTFFNRIGTLQGQDFLLNGQICQDVGGLFAYSLTVGPTIAVCPSAFAKFPPTIGNARHTPQNAKLLDELRPLSNVLVHELIHVFGGPNMLGDFSGGIAPGGERYGYGDCVQMRIDNVDLTTRNPDSIAMFVLAMYLDGNNWASGSSTPLLPA